MTTPAVSYFYDGLGLDAQQSPNYAKGKLTKVTSSVSETRYTKFDYLGRLLESEQRTPFGNETVGQAEARRSKYEYNFSGALVKQTYPNGREVMNAFEPDGDLSRIYGKANANASERTYANSFSYTPDGRIEKLRLGNHRWEWAKFNERLQVTQLNLGSGVNDASLWKLRYDYGEIDANGNVIASKNTGNIARMTTSFNGLAHPFVQSFKYDSLYRLTEARETSNGQQTWKQNFSYDRYGNRINYENFIGTNQQVLDNKTHPSIDPQTNRFNDGQTYNYDFNGNLISDAEGRGFTFNGDNKQAEIKKSNGDPVGRYFYDGEGKRVKKVTNSETVIFIYDGLGKIVAEYTTKEPPTNPTTSFTATDMLGSPRVITDSNGTVTSRRDFQPFGEELFPDGSRRTSALKYGSADGIRQKFTSYQRDDETLLDFAEARMYENRHARFTAVDPLLASGKSANPQTFNRYVYCLNNPLIYTDPSGLQVGHTKRQVYINADGTNIRNSEADGYKPYTGVERLWDGADGYTYRINAGGKGWAQLGKTDPNALDVATQAVKDTAIGAGGSVYNGLAAFSNGFWYVANRATLEYISTGVPRESFPPAEYYEFATPGEQSAAITFSFLSLYYGAASMNTAVTPSFSGFTTRAGTTAIAETNPISNAQNLANSPRLHNQLLFEEAASVFNSDGTLSRAVINSSAPTSVTGSTLKNQAVIAELTKDGSNIADWAKYTTPSFKSPSGSFQVHFYYNSVTRNPNFNFDYKAVYNSNMPSSATRR